jgi:predicted Fe-S protein YdhL (DUF1289 family)
MVNAALSDAAVLSPCINICRLDVRGLCVGCHRTLREIAEWSGASHARRREILRELEIRQVALSGTEVST